MRISIRNRDSLIRRHAHSIERRLCLTAIDAGMNAVEPRALIRSRLGVEKGVLRVDGKRYDLRAFRNIIVVGAGKASGAMAEAVEEILPISVGAVCVPRGTEDDFRTKVVRLIGAGHPKPDAGSVSGGRQMMELVKDAKPDDLVICLFSGGGSALMELPAEGVSLDDMQRVSMALMRRGADIRELNAVRKHLSAIKGGRLAQACRGKILSLLISDVVRSPLDAIASGPTVPDRTTFAAAKRVLQKRKLWDADFKDPVCGHIERGARGRIEETPKKLSNSDAVLLADNNVAVDAAVAFMKAKGFKPVVLRNVEGEARVVGRKLALLLNRHSCFVAGGETTVTVKGAGKGGRNQELALASALYLKRGALASAGTDGMDGNTSAAGGIVDANTMIHCSEDACAARSIVGAYLDANDSNSFFEKFGGAITTGWTGTNVCDLCVGVAHPHSEK
ncbi:glycerate kinase [Candidatus Micrarchaeota archaeon CG10_big_fil_rev_8_21_14_0_10_59_7]|nr:MAG: glycerate kinase [Candidatus Micrarchaeota archaeon CG10_big_fil_rev_8_21_14_0_10_59_7]